MLVKFELLNPLYHDHGRLLNCNCTFHLAVLLSYESHDSAKSGGLRPPALVSEVALLAYLNDFGQEALLNELPFRLIYQRGTSDLSVPSMMLFGLYQAPWSCAAGTRFVAPADLLSGAEPWSSDTWS